MMVLEYESATVEPDTLKANIQNMRTALVRNFSNKLEYSFVKAEKFFSSVQGQSSPNTTQVLVQFDNKREFGIMRFIFDDKTGKILNVKLLEIKRPIPSETNSWLFGALGLLVLGFNIYVIVLIRRSTVIKKWMKYLAIVVLNIPVIKFNAVTGISLNLLKVVFMGVAGSYMGYLDSGLEVGIPLGALYVFWKLRNGLYTTAEDQQALRELEEKVAGAQETQQDGDGIAPSPTDQPV
jgi:hypothetical protein